MSRGQPLSFHVTIVSPLASQHMPYRRGDPANGSRHAPPRGGGLLREVCAVPAVRAGCAGGGAVGAVAAVGGDAIGAVAAQAAVAAVTVEGGADEGPAVAAVPAVAAGGGSDAGRVAEAAVPAGATVGTGTVASGAASPAGATGGTGTGTAEDVGLATVATDSADSAAGATVAELRRTWCAILAPLYVK